MGEGGTNTQSPNKMSGADDELMNEMALKEKNMAQKGLDTKKQERN